MNPQDMILNSINRSVIATDVEGKITYWNGCAQSLYGWAADEVIGKNIADVTPSDISLAHAEDIMASLRSGNRWEGIFPVRRKDGSKFTAFVAVSPMLDDNGKLTGMVGISEDVTGALKEKQFLHTVLRESPIPTAVCGSDGSIISFNAALEELIGYKQSEIADTRDGVLKLCPDPDYGSFVMENLAQALKGEDPECSVFDVTRKDQAKKTLEFHISFFHGGLIVQIVDLTERQTIASEREATIDLLGMMNAEDSLHDLMKLVTEYMHDWSGCDAVGIRLRKGEDYPYFETRGFPKEFVLAESSLCAIDETGQLLRDGVGNVVLECMCGNIIKGRFDPTLPFFTDNGSFCTNSTSDLLAATSEEDRQARTRNRCHGEGYESVALIRLRTSKETLGLLQFNHRNKGKFTPSMIQMFERLAENLALGLSQRIAATALRESEKKIRSILEASTSLVILVDRDGIILDCNGQLPLRFQTTRDALLGKRVWDLLPESVRNERQKMFQQVLETGKAVRMEDCRDGMWNESVLHPIFDEKNKVAAVTVTAHDITDRKLAENALRESEERFRYLADMLPEAVFETDREAKLTYANQKAFELFGYTQDDVDRGLSGFDMLVPEDRERAKAFQSSRINGDDPGAVEYLALRKDGTTFPILFHAGSMFENEALGGLRGIIVDITARKKAEEALRDSETRLREAEKIGRIGNVELDVESGVIYWSELMYELYRRDPEAGLPTYEEVMGMHHPEDAALLEQCVRRAVERAASYELDLRVRLPEGGTAYHHVIGNPIVQDGKVRKIFGTVQDVTAIKQATILLEQTLEATTDGIWYWHLPTNSQSFNPRYYTMLGYEPHEFPATYENWAELVHPDDITSAVSVSREYRRKRADGYEREFRMRTKSGEYRWIRSKARVVERASNGEPVFIIGNHEDITERKEAEGELQKSLAETEASRREVNALLIASNAILINQDFSSTAGMLYNACKELIGATAGFVALLNEDGNENEVLFLDSGDCRCVVDPDLPMPIRGLRAEASRLGKAVYENDFPHCEWMRYVPAGHMSLDNAMFSPLIINKETIGIIGLGNKEGGFNERDVRIATAFGELSAIAVKNSRNLELLSASEEKARGVISSISDSMFIMNDSMVITWMNERAIDIFGDHIGEKCHEAFHGPKQVICSACAVYKTMRDGLVHDHETEMMDRHGNIRQCWCTSGVVAFDSSGKPAAVIKVVRDITERKQADEERRNLQNQLNQAQKMESVGRLAGGVAHDFNNMLSVIIGHTEMALEATDKVHPIYDDLQEIYKAAERSAGLTRQLLAFARKQTIAPKTLNLNQVIEGMLKMLRRLIGEDIDLEWKPAKNLWAVRADPAQIDQILANLCVNARDAIENVGRVSIETNNAVLDVDYCAKHVGLLPGEYVMISVIDNGSGMDADTVDRVFEPFFTRKQQGEGIGLGLATVYGIVKQNSGFIGVESTVGTGSTFKVFLPRHEIAAEQRSTEEAETKNAHGRETILLVEDEEPILSMTTRMLEKLDYSVLAAATPGEAIRIARDHKGSVHLLMTDVIMPEMNGRDLAKNLMVYHPGLKRLFMSGYTADIIAHRGVLDEGVHFIQKPFSLRNLSAKLREVIESE